MFRHSDLDNIDITDLEYSEYEGLTVLSYNQYDFQYSASEESISIIRAPKIRYDSGIKFWLAAVFKDDWEGREQYRKKYISDAKILRISHQKLSKIISTKMYILKKGS